jgi:hypothetical protein
MCGSTTSEEAARLAIAWHSAVVRIAADSILIDYAPCLFVGHHFVAAAFANSELAFLDASRSIPRFGTAGLIDVKTDGTADVVGQVAGVIDFAVTAVVAAVVVAAGGTIATVAPVAAAREFVVAA